MEPADELAAALDAAIGRWVERGVVRLVTAYRGDVSPEVRAAAHDAGLRAQEEVGAELRAFLALDAGEQRTNPLSLLRAAVRFPTAVLRDAGVPPVRRDEFKEHAFPDDVYDLAPATWRDVDEALQEPGIVWGAWKAKTVLDRRRGVTVPHGGQRLGDEPLATEIWVYAPDLMDRSRIGTVPGVRFVARAADLGGAAAGATIVVDLGRPGVLEILPQLEGRRRIGFGSHVDRATLAAARAAGCELVVARSEFFRRLVELLHPA